MSYGHLYVIWTPGCHLDTCMSSGHLHVIWTPVCHLDTWMSSLSVSSLAMSQCSVLSRLSFSASSRWRLLDSNPCSSFSDRFANASLRQLGLLSSYRLCVPVSLLLHLLNVTSQFLNQLVICRRLNRVLLNFV